MCPPITDQSQTMRHKSANERPKKLGWAVSRREGDRRRDDGRKRGDGREGRVMTDDAMN